MAKPPSTPQAPVFDEYHGTRIVDPYRWLEADGEPDVRAWSAAQNRYARQFLDALPQVPDVRRRVTEIMTARTVSYGGVTYQGGLAFAYKYEPPKQQPFLVASDSLFDAARQRTLVDPNQIDPSGATHIDWFRPSHDGKLLAVSLSSGGDEVGDLVVFDVASGDVVGERIPRVNTGTAGGDLAWDADNSGFYYTRHPRDGERAIADMNFYQQVYYHKIGTPTADDRYELGRESPRIAETRLDVDPRTGRALATIQNGDGGEFAMYLRETDGVWRQFSVFGDKAVQAEFGDHEDLYVVSRAEAPRGKILRLPIASLDLERATTIVPPGDDTIVSSFWGGGTLLATDSRLFVVYQLGGPSELRVFDLQGRPLPAPDQLPVASVGGVTSMDGNNVLFGAGSFVEPGAKYLFHAEEGKTEKTAFASSSPVSLADAEVVREFALSKDGTRVPVNILFPRGLRRDHSAPCVATAYGGYGVNITPSFDPLNRILLDHGFVVAVANVRGGGEYGEQWHLQGNLTHKQNVFDDFIAVLEHLLARGYTASERLGITGGSNGGLLMGAVLTQRPELPSVVVSHVGLYDMLRSELSANGEFNITEFGTVKDLAQFKALAAYSPYHHVVGDTPYPAVLMLTGENDPRVEPMQSRKMIARLQAATSSDQPILLRTSAETGHGGDTPLSERIEQEVDVHAFLFHKLVGGKRTDANHGSAK